MSGGYSPGGGCPQTPWAQNVDADGFSLDNLGALCYEYTGSPGYASTLQNDGLGNLGIAYSDILNASVNIATFFTYREDGTNPQSGDVLTIDAGGNKAYYAAPTGGSQTPWLSNIDADQYSLLDAQDIQAERLIDSNAGDFVAGLFNCHFVDSANLNAISIEQRRLINLSGNPVLSFQDSYLLDNAGTTSMDWCSRSLYDSASSQSIDYGNRQLLAPGASTLLDWSGAALFAPSRIYVGGGSDNGNDDIQLNASSSINFGQQIIQRLYTGNILNFNNPAFTQSDACVSWWTQSDLSTAPANGDVLTWDSGLGLWSAAPSGGSGASSGNLYSIQLSDGFSGFIDAGCVNGVNYFEYDCLNFSFNLTDNCNEGGDYHRLQVYSDGCFWNFCSCVTGSGATANGFHFRLNNCSDDFFVSDDSNNFAYIDPALNHFRLENSFGHCAEFMIDCCGAAMCAGPCKPTIYAGYNCAEEIRGCLNDFSDDRFCFANYQTGYSATPCDLIFTLNNFCNYGYTQLDLSGFGLGGVVNSNSGDLILAYQNTSAIQIGSGGFFCTTGTMDICNGLCVFGTAPAVDGTYANPTSITIQCGIVTAIS